LILAQQAVAWKRFPTGEQLFNSQKGALDYSPMAKIREQIFANWGKIELAIAQVR